MSGPAEESTEATLPGARTANDAVLPTRLVRGTTLGRYVVLAQVGAGAMGTVYAAYDPKLDRKVAIKLLLPGRSGERARGRLQREAQALARLSHPNVVAVHDVGEIGGQVFVAMEFVEGQTLRDWIRESRTWQEIVEVFEAAAEGLAAAHAVDLVHRDFKPDNVMLGGDGRVRVMDFGLARSGSDSRSDSSDDVASSQEDAIDLTRTGALLGTPGYMAPEQFAGRVATAESDQFAFCVALHEALLGARPFEGRSPQLLAKAVLAGERRKLSDKGNAPAWLLTIVDRGLATAPKDRFPNMAAVLQALRSGATRRRRRVRLAALGVTGAAIAAVLMIPAWLEDRATAACLELGATIETTWSDSQRAALSRALIENGGPLGTETAERVIPRLDRAAQAWHDQQVLACVESRVHDRWDADTRAKATWCLRRRRLVLDHLVEQVTKYPQGRATTAVTAASALEQSSSCTDLDSLHRSPMPPPEESLPRYMDLMATSRQVSALRETGEFVTGLGVARSLRLQATRRGWQRLAAQGEMAEGHMLQGLGELESAEARLEGSYVRAAKADDWGLAAEVASQLGYAVGIQPRRRTEGLAWLRHAEVAAHHAGDPLGLLEASRLHARALLDGASDQRRHGVRRLEQAAALRERSLGAGHPLVGETIANLGAALYRLGDHEAATTALERAISLLTRAYGPDHPALVPPLNNLAPLAASRGDYDAAERSLRHALRIVEASVGPDAPRVAVLHQNLGTLAERRGDIHAAEVSYRRAVETIERVSGPDGPGIVNARVSLAWALNEQDEQHAARAELERALQTCSERGCEARFEGRARFALAKLLDAEPTRAVELATVARARFGEAGAREQEADVAEWLAEREAASRSGQRPE